MKRVPRVLLMASLLILGCASRENPRFAVLDAKITEGVTTESELVQKLGAPQQRLTGTPIADRDTLAWKYQIPTFTFSRDAYLIVVVRSGVVESYRRSGRLDGAGPSSSK